MEIITLVKAGIKNRKGIMTGFMVLTMLIVVSVITMFGVRKNFDSALETIIAQSKGEKLPEGYVPQTVYYLWDDDNIVGTFHFRHYLCQSLIEGSGHIGYYIAPEYRGKGYASQGLKLLINEIRDDVQEDEIYLRVKKDNPASLKVMLNNGGYIHHQDDTKYYVRIKR